MAVIRLWRCVRPWCLGLNALLAVGFGMPVAAAERTPVRVYSHYLEPQEHPDYERRAVQPPNWETFGRRTQFTALRGFAVEDGRIVRFREELDKYTRTHGLGNVVWPSYPILFATNLAELATELKRRELYLFDIWGYVPGSGPGGYWQQFRVPADALETLESILGDRWLGTDIGEQDGRYIGGYAGQMTPASGSRREQYLQFQRHFERMGDDLGHRHATLVSLNFGHYLLKEGTYALIGAETAQALPNNQVYYAFIRGAGKQYGVPWFGNASIFNRWGFKTYGSSGRSDGYEHGPTKGTSLSLLRRLLYCHVLYNSVAVGFENGWFEGEALSPIGRVQQAAQRWVTEHGVPGVMHTPVALVLDFNAGWSFPRHLYTDHLYRCWGNLPYEASDHFVDGILDLLYPGYADASYFHDETGFMAATPYGDIADCLLSDAPSWLLERYGVVVLAGAQCRGELRDKLEAYVQQGGHLVATGAKEVGVAEGFSVRPGDSRRVGRGRVTVLASETGVVPARESRGPRGGIDRSLVSPRPLERNVQETLAAVFRQQRLVEVDPRLSLVTCRKGPGEYTVGIFNNTWQELPLDVRVIRGTLLDLRELPLGDGASSFPGYLPEGIEGSRLGAGGARRIAGGDVRIFAVRVRESKVEDIPHRQPPPRPAGRYLTLRHPRGIKEAVLMRPSFFQHFDGVMVDWRYLGDRERGALAREGTWLRRQGLRVAVDLSSGLNLYPDLRLVDNLPEDYAATRARIRDVIGKMPLLGARDLVFSLHRHPENNFTDTQTRASFESTVKQLTAEAAEAGVTLHLRQAFGKPPWSLADSAAFVEGVGAPNLRLAVSTAMLAAHDPGVEAARPILERHGGLWLVAAPHRDPTGRVWDAHGPVATADEQARQAVHRWLARAPRLPWVLDAVLEETEEEYREVRSLREAVSVSVRTPAERE